VVVVVFARLVLVALVGLPLPLNVALMVLARHEGLRLCRDKTRLLSEVREILAVVVTVLGRHLTLAARLRLVLTELLLGGGNQAEIVLGVLIVVLRGHRVARAAR